MLEDLYAVLRERQKTKPEGSYTVSLLEEGQPFIARKVGEEALEVVLAATSENPERLAEEIGDLFYHVLVLMLASEITLADLSAVLERRQNQR